MTTGLLPFQKTLTALNKKKNKLPYITYLQHYFFLTSHFAIALRFLFLGPNKRTKSIIIKKQV